MKTLKIGLLAVVMMTLMSTNSQAALLIEPHIGYNVSGTGDFTWGGQKVETDYSGAQYGLRAGWQYLGFMLGMDYTMSNPEVEFSAQGQTEKNDMKNKELGVFAGYNLPILLRGWVGYYFNVKSEADNNGSFNKGDEFSGNTMELGVGFTGLPLVSLNLMYRNVTLDEIKTSAGTLKLSGNQEIKNSEIVFGVSIPFTL